MEELIGLLRQEVKLAIQGREACCEREDRAKWTYREIGLRRALCLAMNCEARQ